MSLYLSMHIDRPSKDDDDDWEIPECGGIGQNLVSEPDLIFQLEESGCMLLAQYIEWDEEDDDETFWDPNQVLVEVEKARPIMESLPEDDYQHGKEAALEDLADLEKAVRWAIAEGHRVGFMAC